MLKQLGAGSLEKGLAAVRSNEGALQEVAQLVHVEPPVSAPQLPIRYSFRAALQTLVPAGIALALEAINGMSSCS